MADSAVCPQCLCSVFSLVHGVKYCDGCGTQLQDFMEEQAEFEFSQMTKSRAHSSQQPKEDGGGGKQRRAFVFNDCAETYARALQTLLHDQVSFLVSTYGCHAGLAETVRSLWRAYVLRSGLLEPQFEEDAAGEGSQVKQEGQTEERGRGQAPGATAVAAQPKMVEARELHTLLWQHAPPAATMELLYLGVLLMREALQPCDLVRAAMAGHLPYLSLPSLAVGAVGSTGTELPEAVLKPRGKPIAYTSIPH
uniref:Rrn7/TAF1B N-terminal cyclin domain-containing protein n=1 Tax=Tetraselmis chuii TaxID=63592 RepID=A0A7S1SIF1_9CHLO|mmetsp:Transcript_13815/g.24468  ORF Transcript_13815/g.24468 Transcript_13815/m.24468 type:complete len:251 (+) Transcript_13815:76-828(+)